MALIILIYAKKKYIMEFNRETPNFNSNILITLILIYPNPFSILKRKLIEYINIMSEAIDFNFSTAIITFNKDISTLMINNSSQINLKYISRFYLNNLEIPNSEIFTFVTHSSNKAIDVFYTNIRFSKFVDNFVNKAYYTSVKFLYL